MPAAAGLGDWTSNNLPCRPCRWGHLHEYCSTEAALAALADMSVEEQLAALRAFSGAADAIDQDAASEAPDHGDVNGEADSGQPSTADDGDACGSDAAAAAQAGPDDQACSSADAAAAGAEQTSEASHREVVGDGSGYMPQYRERFFTADGSSCAAGSGMLVSSAPSTGCLIAEQHSACAHC